MVVALLLAVPGILVGCGGVDSGFPPPPSGFLLTSPTNTTTVVGTMPTLNWTDASGETEYHVQTSVDQTFNNFVYTAVVPANTTSYAVLASTLTASTTYYWRVRAVNNSGASTLASNAPFSFTTTL